MAGNVGEKSIACFENFWRVVEAFSVVEDISDQGHKYLADSPIYKVLMLHVKILYNLNRNNTKLLTCRLFGQNSCKSTRNKRQDKLILLRDIILSILVLPPQKPSINPLDN